MIEIVVLAILALAFVGGYIFSARERDAVSQMWPAIKTEVSRGEPVEEGAPVLEGEPRIPQAETRKAA